MRSIILDTSPLGLVTQRRGRSSNADACQDWMEDLLVRGFDISIPEIADYELRREMIRQGLLSSIVRLDKLKGAVQYLPLTTAIMLQAADLWAQSRNAGVATSDQHALDGDVILCAQALSLNRPPTDFIVATGNVKHITRFVPADLWSNIKG